MTVGLLARIYSDEYYLHLGRFVSEFTEIECSMQVALWRLSKIQSPVAQAVFSGVRAEEANNKITRIGEAENWSAERKEAWKSISDHLGILRTLRNDILHYGAHWQPDGTWIVTNKPYVHIPQKVTQTPVTIDALKDATADLNKLSLHLFNFLFGDEMPVNGLLHLSSELHRAWRYKSSRQGGRPRTTRDEGQAQSRQPKSFQKSPRKDRGGAS